MSEREGDGFDGSRGAAWVVGVRVFMWWVVGLVFVGLLFFNHALMTQSAELYGPVKYAVILTAPDGFVEYFLRRRGAVGFSLLAVALLTLVQVTVLKKNMRRDEVILRNAVLAVMPLLLLPTTLFSAEASYYWFPYSIAVFMGFTLMFYCALHVEKIAGREDRRIRRVISGGVFGLALLATVIMVVFIM